MTLLCPTFGGHVVGAAQKDWYGRVAGRENRLQGRGHRHFEPADSCHQRNQSDNKLQLADVDLDWGLFGEVGLANDFGLQM
jgi:hypothetical protein